MCAYNTAKLCCVDFFFAAAPHINIVTDVFLHQCAVRACVADNKRFAEINTAAFFNLLVHKAVCLLVATAFCE